MSNQERKESSFDKVFDYWNKHSIHAFEFPKEFFIEADFNQIDYMRWSENEFWAKTAFYDLPGNANTRLLDAGCGIGVFTRFYTTSGFNKHG